MFALNMKMHNASSDRIQNSPLILTDILVEFQPVTVSFSLTANFKG